MLTTPNPLLLPHLASAAPLVIARLLIQHLPSPTLIGGRARTLPRQARSAPILSRPLLLSIRGGGSYMGISAISIEQLGH